MFDTYNNIAHQIFKNNPGKIYLSENEELLNKFRDDESFILIFESLKDTYASIYKLVGEENFKILTVKYMQLNPAHTINGTHYGKSFPEFLLNIKELEAYSYIAYLARVDWYWKQETIDSDALILPKGSLESWYSSLADDKNIEIDLNTEITEEIKIVVESAEYKMKSKVVK